MFTATRYKGLVVMRKAARVKRKAERRERREAEKVERIARRGAGCAD
jgi:hypothetical protein